MNFKGNLGRRRVEMGKGAESPLGLKFEILELLQRGMSFASIGRDYYGKSGGWVYNRYREITKLIREDFDSREKFQESLLVGLLSCPKFPPVKIFGRKLKK
jgi:hypothetical protein